MNQQPVSGEVTERVTNRVTCATEKERHQLQVPTTDNYVRASSGFTSNLEHLKLNYMQNYVHSRLANSTDETVH
nr:hypothetical protein [Tanacetum cinerariifolium]